MRIRWKGKIGHTTQARNCTACGNATPVRSRAEHTWTCKRLGTWKRETVESSFHPKAAAASRGHAARMTETDARARSVLSFSPRRSDARPNYIRAKARVPTWNATVSEAKRASEADIHHEIRRNHEALTSITCTAALRSFRRRHGSRRVCAAEDTGRCFRSTTTSLHKKQAHAARWAVNN